MEPADHARTASHPSQPGSVDFRAREAQLYQEGGLDAAMQPGIDDLRDKFGGKYEEGIRKAVDAAHKK
jgi:filamentous hemagglutinin